MKYVMFENELGHKIPVIFPDKIVHSDMAEYVSHMMGMCNEEFVKPVSAGFISFKAKVSGRSESLKLDSKEEDSMYITFNDSIGTLPMDMMTTSILETLRDKMKE